MICPQWTGRPTIDFGLASYIKLNRISTFEQLINFDFSIKPRINFATYKYFAKNGGNVPTWEEFKKAYANYFTIVDNDGNPILPEQQSLETIMQEKAEIEKPAEPEKPKKEENPGSVYGDTPNGIKQQPISFADIFNKTAQPLEIEGKKYQPRLELIDVDTNNN